MYERAMSQVFPPSFYEVIPHPGKATKIVLDLFDELYDQIQNSDTVEVDWFPITTHPEMSYCTTVISFVVLPEKPNP